MYPRFCFTIYRHVILHRRDTIKSINVPTLFKKLQYLSLTEFEDDRESIGYRDCPVSLPAGFPFR